MKELKSPAEVFRKAGEKIKPEWKTAFFSTLILGICIHMPAFLMDVPNHDGLDSMYFDQNMITSGRWFLTVACGISSYFTLPWVIGLLSVFYLALTSVLLTEFLELRNRGGIILMSGFLAAFPAFASTYAYVFTMDGYMLGMLLAVAAPLCVKKFRSGTGILTGGLCLAFSLGIYQSYLPFAMMLSLYSVILILFSDETVRNKVKRVLSYLGMGVFGAGLYYLILRVLLLIQGKELASYQGINASGLMGKESFLSVIGRIYRDFLAFSVRGNVVFRSGISFWVTALLVLLFLTSFILCAVREKWYKKAVFYVVLVLLPVTVPLITNVLLLISPDATYHLLMRYQWVLFPILMLAFLERWGKSIRSEKWKPVQEWAVLILAGVLIFHYALVDQIAYSNLQKKYEKTYAYCVRLVDRMEQTEGYYRGIPVAMIGVVSDEQYPETDITGKVTSNMIGIPGDMLLYTRTNYQAFLKHYMGVTVRLVSDEEMLEIYDSPEYRALGSFPEKECMKVVDGILYVKLENQEE